MACGPADKVTEPKPPKVTLPLTCGYTGNGKILDGL